MQTPGYKKQTLLIVDDEEGPRQSLKIVFKEDYNILIAKSGEEAIELIGRSSVDAVISDIRMTGISGIELLAALKKIDPDVQVIMLTAYETIESARGALRHGACDYLNKPFDIPQIRTAVAGAMEKRAIAIHLHGTTSQLSHLQEEIEKQRILSSMQQTQGEIYASVIHDINNPLTIISCFSEMINQCIRDLNKVDGETLDVLRQHMSQITAQVHKCNDISHRYLGFLRQQRNEKSVVNVRQILSDLRHLLLSHPEAQDHRFYVRDLDNDLIAEINGTDLIQILVNLVVNAFQSAPRAAVNVSAQQINAPLDLGHISDHPSCQFINPGEFQNRPPFVEITITDNGPGIPPDVFPHIFEIYFTTKPPGKGTGLGLGIVERLVRKSGGVLHVNSETDRGTTFTIYIPIQQG